MYIVDNKFYLDCYSKILDKHSDELLPEIVSEAISIIKDYNYITEAEEPIVTDFIVDVLSSCSITDLIGKEPYELIELIYNEATDQYFTKAGKYFLDKGVTITQTSFEEVAKLVKESRLSDVITAINSLDDGTIDKYTKGMFKDEDNELKNVNSFNVLTISFKLTSDIFDWPEFHKSLERVFSNNLSYDISMKGNNSSYEIVIENYNKKDNNTTIIKNICKVINVYGYKLSDMNIKTRDSYLE